MGESPLPRVWRFAGRCLPRAVRELVYEPACFDLWIRHARDGSAPWWRARIKRIKLWITFGGYLMAAGATGLPRYFIDRGRLTGFGRLTALAAVVVGGAMVVLLLPWIAELARVAGQVD